MIFEELADWLADQLASGETHDLSSLAIPDDGIPVAEEFFSTLEDALGDLHDYGEVIEVDDSQWLIIRAFTRIYVIHYDYCIYDCFKTMHEVHEFIDNAEDEAEAESQRLKDTYDDLNRWLDSGG